MATTIFPETSARSSSSACESEYPHRRSLPGSGVPGAPSAGRFRAGGGARDDSGVQAQDRSGKVREFCRRSLKLSDPFVLEILRRGMKKHWSPEQVIHREQLSLSVPTVYRGNRPRPSGSDSAQPLVAVAYLSRCNNERNACFLHPSAQRARRPSSFTFATPCVSRETMLFLRRAAFFSFGTAPERGTLFLIRIGQFLYPLFFCTLPG